MPNWRVNPYFVAFVLYWEEFVLSRNYNLNTVDTTYSRLGSMTIYFIFASGKDKNRCQANYH